MQMKRDRFEVVLYKILIKFYIFCTYVLVTFKNSYNPLPNIQIPLTLRIAEYVAEPAGFVALHVYLPECR